MVAIVTLTVILRYCFNTGLSWAEKVPRLLVTVFAFIACAIGVRDHMHVAVNAIYNKFRSGQGEKALDVLTDIVVLLCGLFMLISGGARTAKLFTLPGVLPITGISTAWQYLPIPVAGFVMSFDSVLFLTGIVSRDDLLYSEPEVDFTDEAAVAAMTKEAEKK
ncbi:MAG: TRAP transporter small permease [Christensenellales bacterium]